MSAANLQTIKDQALANLIDATENPKPTYSIDGQRVDHAGYVLRLQRLVDWCDGKLAALDPVEIATQAGHP